MACDEIKDATGRVIGHMCGGRRSRPKRCPTCANGIATLLCDGPLMTEGSKTTTCDRPICKACAWHTGPDCDLCPHCAEARRKNPVALRSVAGGKP